jgi:Protein of unknown function (DUF2844)
MPSPPIRFLAAVILGLALTSSTSAWATLGQDEASIQSDQGNGTRRIEAVGRHSMHEIRMSSGTVVREFVSGGAVFAVAWDGPFLPDLRHLLGAYSARASDGARARRRGRGHGPLLIRTPELVVENSGHMRRFRGRAYLPARVPPDVSLTAIH